MPVTAPTTVATGVERGAGTMLAHLTSHGFFLDVSSIAKSEKYVKFTLKFLTSCSTSRLRP